MANLNIAIQIAAKDNASGPIGRIKSALGGLGDSAKKGFAGLQNVAKIAGGALVVGGVAAGVAVAGIGVAAFNVANDVQTATSDIQAQLGTTTEEAERLGDVALEVFGNNFAGSVGEAGQAVALVRQQLGDLADDELQRVTENAFRLSDTFGVETPESINAAKTLMEDFGLTSDQAFDFIASGFQRGLDRSGDFLDTIGEYSTQFANGGADAGQFFSLMESGLQGGMLGTDKAADAFKEFRVRIQDGSKTTSEALAALGIDADEMAAGMADGTVTAADAFQLVVDKLNEVDDENVRMQAGVGLLGTQFEDLGTDAALALSTIGTNMGDLEGAASSLDTKYNNLGSVFEGFKRRALVAIEPIGGVLLDIANSAMPLVNTAFAFFETNIAPAIETAAGVVQSFLANLQEGMSPIDAFIEAIWGLAPPEVLAFLVNLRDEVLPGLSAWFTDSVQPVIDMITQFVSWQDVLVALGIVVAAAVLPALVGIVAAAAPVIAVGAALVGAIALARNAWENDWGGIQEKTQAVIDFVVPLVQGALASIQSWWQENGEQIIASVTQAWETVQTAFNTAVTFISRVIKAGLGVIQGFWKGHGETVMTVINLAWDNIKTIIDTAVTVVQSIIAAFRAAMEGDWHEFGEQLRVIWDTIWQAIGQILSNQILALGTIVSDIVSSIKDWFTNTDWGGVGTSIIQGIASGITGGIGIIGDAATSAARAAFEAAKGFLGIDSPSRLFEVQVGENISAGAAAGILGGLGDVQSAMSAILQPPRIPSLAGTGSGGLALAGGAPGAPAGGGITIGSITINAGTYEGGREAGRGFVDELTRRGLGPL